MSSAFTNKRERLETESVEAREARLQQMSLRHHKRHAEETVQQREGRSRHMRDRIAAETAEEREARLRQIKDRH